MSHLLLEGDTNWCDKVSYFLIHNNCNIVSRELIHNNCDIANMSYPNSCFMWKDQRNYEICVNKHADRLYSGASVLRAGRSLHCYRKPIDTRKFGLEVSVQRTHVQTVGKGRVYFISEAKGNQNTRLAFVLKKS